MANNMNLKSIALHTMEFLVVVGLAFVVSKTFGITAEQYQLLVMAVLAAFAKTVRDLGFDYVNK